MGFDELADEFPALYRHQQSCFRMIDPQQFVSGQGLLRAREQETFYIIQPGICSLQKFLQFRIRKTVLYQRNGRGKGSDRCFWRSAPRASRIRCREAMEV